MKYIYECTFDFQFFLFVKKFVKYYRFQKEYCHSKYEIITFDTCHYGIYKKNFHLFKSASHTILFVYYIVLTEKNCIIIDSIGKYGNNLSKEIQMLTMCNGIIHMLNYNQKCIILEKCKCTLFDYIQTHILSESQMKKITRMIMIQILNFKKFYNLHHLDLKLENICIRTFSPFEICFIDFETANTEEEWERTNYKYTLLYAPPEIIHHETNVSLDLIDTWQLGIMVYLLYTLHFPFTKKQLMSKEPLIIQDKIENKDALDFMTLCFQPSHKRPFVMDLLNHPWIYNHHPYHFYNTGNPNAPPATLTIL